MSPTPLRLLLADDSPNDAELLLNELRQSGFEPQMMRVECAADFERALHEGAWDIVLADFNMPGFGGLEALAIHQASGLDLPFLLVSGTIGEEVAVSAMIAGAHDYVLKDNLTRLGPAVSRELREYQVRRGRREDHQRVVASERRFNTIFKNSPVATIITDVHDGTIFDLNPAALNLLGVTREAAIGRRTTEFGHGLDLADPTRLVSTALAAGPGHAIERSLQLPDRGPCTVLASFSLIELDGKTRLLVMMQDISDRKAAEETLRESEERYRLLVENSHDLVAELADGCIHYASPNHLTITGHSSAELVGSHFVSFAHPEDRALVAARLGRVEGHSCVRYRFRHRDGHWLSLESAARAFTTSIGERHVVVMTRDLTEQLRAEATRRELESQLRQAQKMEAIGTLAGGIAHDFNNILTAIFGYVQLAELELEPDHSARAHLTGVMRGSQRARDLVSQILTFSRRRDQQRTIVKPEPIVREALDLLRASLPATIQFRAELDPGAPAVLCDSTQLHQVIMNLGTNAAHAMNEHGGTLTVTLGLKHPEPTVASSHHQFTRRPPVCLTISDTGIGMDAATRDRMFEPFFTTKPTGIGTGLGLAVVHGIVQDHDGAIVCDSAPGAGTTFRIYLPTVDVEGMQALVLPDELPRGHGERVLVIDDEESVVAITTRMLNALGYRPIAFTDSQAAMEELNRAPDDISIVLTDLTMSRMTGVDIAREARARRPTLPVVITTGFMNSREVEAARALGVRHFLEKPFTLASIADCLRQAVASAAANGVAR